jgi:AcrR family transcriptional regulator
MGDTIPTPKKWDKRQTVFLKWLAKTGNVAASCRKAKINRSLAYEWRNGDEVFAAAWDEALEIATELLEEEARRRAQDGVLEPVFYLGKRAGAVRRYSDTLLIFLLKAHRPDKYRDNHRHEHVVKPVTVRHDLSKLSVIQLRQLRELVEQTVLNAAGDHADTAEPSRD